jgi:hypothetical protein
MPDFDLLPMLVLSLLLSTSPQSPAAPTPATPAAAAAPLELAELAQRVERAHRPDGAVPPVTALRASLEVQLLDATAENRGQAELAVQFLEWKRPNSDKTRPLIRYEIRQAEGPLVRGRDRDGPWHLFRGEPRDLTPEFAQDQKACARDLALAQQLVRFLSPADVLRALQKVSKVAAESLPIARGESIACNTVAGDLPAFPLLRQDGDDVPVRLRAWIDAASDRLVGIDVWPLVGAATDPKQGERILLLELHARDGVLLPRRLEHSFRDAEGRLRPQLRTRVITAELRPELRSADFDRPQPSSPQPK